VLQYVVMWCSVMQGVAVCYSVLQCAAVCCNEISLEPIRLVSSADVRAHCANYEQCAYSRD